MAKGKSTFRKAPMQFDLSGVPAVHAVLKELSSEYGNSVERKLARAALGAGLTMMARLMRRDAPKHLKKAIGTRQQRQRGKGTYGAKAGINVGKKGGTAPHAHFFVLGTKDRFTKRRAFRGRVQPNHFVRRAIEQGGVPVRNAMLARIAVRLPIEVDKARRKSLAAVGQHESRLAKFT